MYKKRLTSLILASALSGLMLCMPVTSTSVYADEAAVSSEELSATEPEVQTETSVTGSIATEGMISEAETATETETAAETEIETIPDTEAAAETEAAPDTETIPETEPAAQAETSAYDEPEDEEPVLIKAEGKPIADCTISAFSNKTYSGKAQTQTFTVTDETTVLTKGVDYKVKYTDNINAGTATVTITGMGDYSGTAEKTFRIAPKNVTPAVTLAKNSYVYSGNNLRPPATVKAGSVTLEKGTDYTVTYPTSCSDVGSYNVTVTLKGNYTGSIQVPYTVVPKSTRLFSVVGTNSQFTAKWYRQTTQVTGYQVQYNLTGDFSTGSKHVWVTSSNSYFRTITKPVAGRNYFVRVRTYKNVDGKRYYSAWSGAVSTITKKTLYPDQMFAVDSPFHNSRLAQDSFKFTINNSMYIALPIRLDVTGDERDVTKGGIWVILTDSKGNVVKKTPINLKGYADGSSLETWVNSGEDILRPGEYTYTIKNTADTMIVVTLGDTIGFTKKSTTVSISKNVTSETGKWVKIGKLTDGIPIVKDVTYPDNHVIESWYCDSNGNLSVWGGKLGTATVTVTADDGKTYRSTVTLTAGDPYFAAYIDSYDTANNCFIVKILNYNRDDLIIHRGGMVMVDDSSEYDRNIKEQSNVTARYGETKTVRFYLEGDTTWDQASDFTLVTKFTYEGKTYTWHVKTDDSYYQKGDDWYYTYQ